MMKLLSIDGNSKIVKTNKVAGDNHEYAGLSLMPDDKLCPGAKAAGCMPKCLKSAGRGKFSNVSKARTNKSAMFHNNPVQFRYWLVKDLEALVRRVNKKGKIARVRLNVLSDVAWEKYKVIRDGIEYEGVPQAFPEIQFYDYTKRADRVGKTPANYKLTFSYSGVSTYTNQVRLAEDRDANMAVVFLVKKGQRLPEFFRGKPVIDGDEHDARWDDAQGVIVGLRAKGDCIGDDSGFAVAA